MSDPANQILDTDEVFGESKPKEDSEKQQQAEVADTIKKDIKRNQTPMELYYERVREMDGKYSLAISDHAKKEEFVIPIEKVDANKQLTGEYENKTFKRKKINSKAWDEVENLREEIFAEKDRKKVRQGISKLYWRCAQEYFKMSKEDYERASWEDIKLAIDAANFRTVKSLPYSQ